MAAPSIDFKGAFLELVVGRVSPSARARLAWREAGGSDPSAKLLAALTPPGSVAVDCGASWGMFAHRLAELVGPEGIVHAFEPNGKNSRSLASMAQAAGGRIRVHRAALGDAPGLAELHVPTRRGRKVDAMGSLSVPSSRGDTAAEPLQVEVVTLEGALGGDAARVGFVKCDVEGHELAVLRGAEGVLSSRRPALLVEIEQRHQDRDIEDTVDYLLGLGYDGYMVRAAGLRPVAEFDVDRDQLSLVDPSAVQPVVPPGYVHDFVFVAEGADVTPLMAAA